MLTSNLFFNHESATINKVISSVIDEMKAHGANAFLTIMTEPEVYAYVYRELSDINRITITELLVNVNKIVA